MIISCENNFHFSLIADRRALFASSFSSSIERFYDFTAWQHLSMGSKSHAYEVQKIVEWYAK